MKIYLLMLLIGTIVAVAKFSDRRGWTEQDRH
jgi:hypothetical protein